jgi:hypothetical protein
MNWLAIMKKNEEKKKELQEKQKQNNRQVLASYQIKGKA